jgi:hypothetical protein
MQDDPAFYLLQSEETARIIMQLEEEVATLRARLDHLEAMVTRLIATVAPKAPADLGTKTRLHAWLIEQGVSSLPSSLEQAAADHWHALSDEEKQRLHSELDTLPAGPMVSDIVIDQR